MSDEIKMNPNANAKLDVICFVIYATESHYGIPNYMFEIAKFYKRAIFYIVYMTEVCNMMYINHYRYEYCVDDWNNSHQELVSQYKKRNYNMSAHICYDKIKRILMELPTNTNISMHINLSGYGEHRFAESEIKEVNDYINSNNINIKFHCHLNSVVDHCLGQLFGQISMHPLYYESRYALENDRSNVLPGDLVYYLIQNPQYLREVFNKNLERNRVGYFFCTIFDGIYRLYTNGYDFNLMDILCEYENHPALDGKKYEIILYKLFKKSGDEPVDTVISAKDFGLKDIIEKLMSFNESRICEKFNLVKSMDSKDPNVAYFHPDISPSDFFKHINLLSSWKYDKLILSDRLSFILAVMAVSCDDFVKNMAIQHLTTGKGTWLTFEFKDGNPEFPTFLSHKFLYRIRNLSKNYDILTKQEETKVKFLVNLINLSRNANLKFLVNCASTIVGPYNNYLSDCKICKFSRPIELLDCENRCVYCNLEEKVGDIKYDQFQCIECNCFSARNAAIAKSTYPKCHYCCKGVQDQKKTSTCHGCKREYICATKHFESILCGYCQSQSDLIVRKKPKILMLKDLPNDIRRLLYQCFGVRVRSGMILNGKLVQCLKNCEPCTPLEIIPNFESDEHKELYMKIFTSVKSGHTPNKTCNLCAKTSREFYTCCNKLCKAEICNNCCKKHYEIKMGTILLPSKIACPFCRAVQNPRKLKMMFKNVEFPEKFDAKMYYVSCGLCQKVVPHSSKDCNRDIPDVQRFLCSNHTPSTTVQCQGVVSVNFEEEGETKIKSEICDMAIERISGCQHVICEVCKNHVCSDCGKAFVTSSECYAHINQVHGGLKFETPLSELTNDVYGRNKYDYGDDYCCDFCCAGSDDD